MSIPHVNLKHLIESAQDERSLDILAKMARDEGSNCWGLAHRPGASQVCGTERSARDLFTGLQKQYEALEIQAVERRAALPKEKS